MLRIKNVPRVNEEGLSRQYGTSATAKRIIESQKREIALLRQELAMHDALAGSSPATTTTSNLSRFKPLNKQALLDIHNTARKYINKTIMPQFATETDMPSASDPGEVVATLTSETSVPGNAFDLIPELHSVRVINAYFESFRKILLEFKTESLDSSLNSTIAKAINKNIAKDEVVVAVTSPEIASPSELKKQHKLSHNQANSSCDTTPVIDGPSLSNLRSCDIKARTMMPTATKSLRSKNINITSNSSSSSITQIEEAEIMSYEEWCGGEGKELVKALAKAKSQLQEHKLDIKEKATKVNECKRCIDKLQAALDTAIADTPRNEGELGDAFRSSSDSDDTGTARTLPTCSTASVMFGPHILQLRRELKQEKARYVVTN